MTYGYVYPAYSTSPRVVSKESLLQAQQRRELELQSKPKTSKN